MDKEDLHDLAVKVPAVTLGFWVIKILATTFGETAGDTVSMTLNWGYLAGTALFAAIFIALAVIQIRASRFNPWLYWGTIIASTTVGTTLADFCTRSIGIGYPGGSLLLVGALLASLLVWYRAMGSISVETLHEPRAETYYWITITFSQTLGTALGDWIADGPLGYLGAAGIFGAALAILAILYFRTKISNVALFWAAFVLTRPLGATVGDFLDKPLADGGLALSRPLASAVLAAAILALIIFLPQRAGTRTPQNTIAET